MIRKVLFLLPLIASCNGLSRSMVYNMDSQGSNEENPSLESYVPFKVDEFEDKYIFNQMALVRWKLWYSTIIFTYKPTDNPEKAILDLYKCIDQDNKMPFFGEIGKQAVYKAWKSWQQGKQIFGQKKEIFGKDSDYFTRTSEGFREIPEPYKQACLKMILELVDMLFQMRPQKYGELSKKLTDFEQSLSEPIKKGNPYYSEEMAYLKKLLMEHFNTIDKETFYSKFYASHIAYLQKIHILLPLVVCTGSDAVQNGFFNFLKQKGRKIDLGNYTSMLILSRTKHNS